MCIEFHYLELIRSYGEENKETFTDPCIYRDYTIICPFNNNNM